MRRHAKASSAGSITGNGTSRTRKSLFGMACACVLGFTAFAGSGAPSAGAAEGPCPNAQVRTGPGALLPDCRAYEQVSPVDKNGGDVSHNGGAAENDVVQALPIAADGGMALFSANTEFADAHYGGGPNPTLYAAARTLGGWSVNAMVPPLTPPAGFVRVALSAEDLRLSLLNPLGARIETDPPDTSDGTFTIYSRNNVLGNVTPFIGMSPTPGNEHIFSFPVATPDMGHVAFVTNEALTDDPVPGDFFAKVYERVGGQTRLVSIRPDGTPADHAFLGSAGEQLDGAPLSTMGAMSSDGRHIFFNDSVYYGNPKELYRRTDGTTTVSASPSKASVMDPMGVQTKTFRLASTDGRRVFFTSSQLLTDDANTGPFRAGSDLYRYDVDADELIDISATADGGDGARVAGVLGADDDGDSVYYVAFGQVVPGEGSATGAEPNLYLWEDDGTPEGTTRFIATLSASDDSNWLHLDARWTARVTSDGRTLMFESEAAIPGYDNGGVRQIYRYGADGDAGAGELICVSCNLLGDTPIGGASIPIHRGASGTQRWEQVHALSGDGSRIFFNTPDALVARDSNGEIDPYMWEEEGGQVSLLSTGTDPYPSFFYNATESGEDAFIVTAEALVPQDGDDLVDLYDARVGGGIASQFAVRPPDCSGEECRGTGTQPPAASPPLTPSFQSPGNATAKHSKGRCAKGKRRVKARNGKTRCVKRKSARKRKQNRANSNRRASR